MVNQAEDELLHYGRKGMKWYQSIYGSKKSTGTTARKTTKSSTKKEDSLASKIKESRRLRKEHKQRKADEKLAKKGRLDKMTDEELMKAINRARMEDTYNQLRPEKVSLGKRFASATLDRVIAPAAATAGKKALETLLNKATNNVFKEAIDPNSVEGMKKTLEKLNLQKEINSAKNDWTNKKAQSEYEKAQVELEKSKVDLEQKRRDLTNPKPEKIDWENENKRQINIQNRMKTEKAELEYEEWKASLSNNKSPIDSPSTKQKADAGKDIVEDWLDNFTDDYDA